MLHDDKLVSDLLQGKRSSVARAISLVENDHPDSVPLLRMIYSRCGNAYRIGITGPPGAGKSTIANQLAKIYRDRRMSVGIIAVDPTSPFSGGALLGDRVRMGDVELDREVFIRSMASRGSIGGLCKKATEAADILDASGFDLIIMETIGVGQSELDIARAADTTLVVLVPESGDSIQAMKAGLMEIADLFVINKSDRAGAEQTALSISMVLNFKKQAEVWRPLVLQTVAYEGKGIDLLVEKIEGHRTYLLQHGLLDKRRRERIVERIKELVTERLKSEFWTKERDKLLHDRVSAVLSRLENPYDVAAELINSYKQ